jgi:hypothetical protein
MTIDEAIKLLQGEKEAGRTNIILAYWGADMFDMEDDEEWAEKAERVESKMDWSNTHDQMSMMIDMMGESEGEDEDDEE